MYIPEGYKAVKEDSSFSCQGCDFNEDPCSFPHHKKNMCEVNNVIFKKNKPRCKRKIMKKSSLKTGMIIEVESYGDCQTKFMVLLNTGVGDVLINSTGWIELDEYDDILQPWNSSTRKIKKVYIQDGIHALRMNLNWIDYTKYKIEPVGQKAIVIEGEEVYIPLEEYENLKQYK